MLFFIRQQICVYVCILATHFEENKTNLNIIMWICTSLHDNIVMGNVDDSRLK